MTAGKLKSRETQTSCLMLSPADDADYPLSPPLRQRFEHVNVAVNGLCKAEDDPPVRSVAAVRRRRIGRTGMDRRVQQQALAGSRREYAAAGAGGALSGYAGRVS